MTLTARKAGADTVPGLIPPLAVRANVAGTRTWTEPLAGVVVVPAGETPPLESLVVPPGEAPPLPAAVLVLEAVVVVVEDLAAVLEADVLDAMLLGVEEVLDATDAELEECDPPQPASASAATAEAKKQVRPLTFSA